MKYDSFIIGPVSLDVNIDCEGNVVKNVGGAVVYSGLAASQCGWNTAVLTKANAATCEVEPVFAGSGVHLQCLPSQETCSIKNQYFTPDKEKRACTSMGKCDPFTVKDLEDLGEIVPSVYHFAGLVWGDFEEELFPWAAKHGKVAVDVQCLLRHVEANKTMAFHDWANKKKYLPYIDFLKTDAAEAEILTGTSDRCAAAELLHKWGAKEILITHNTEVLAYNGEKFYTCPIRSRNLSGRTGRGDTTFAGYINSRLSQDIASSLLFATALVSLKMEKAGPFRGTRQDVEKYICDFYTNEK